MSRLRMAVIGGGHLGTIHTKLLSNNPHVEFVGIVDPDEETRIRLATDFEVCAFPNLWEIIGRIDAAIVSTPTLFHADIASKLIDQGIHTLIEKPITTNTTEADSLIRLAKEKRVLLQVGHVEQFNPTWNAVREHIVSAKFLEAHRCAPFSFRSTDISVVHDLMIHDLELILSVVNSRVVDVHSSGSSMLTGLEDFAAATIRFENDCVANLMASRIHPKVQRELFVVADGEQYHLDFVGQTATKSTLNRKFARTNPHLDCWSSHDLAELRASLTDDALPVTEVEVNRSVNAIHEEHMDFIDSIHQGKLPRVTGEKGRDALAIADKIVNQIRQTSSRQRLRAA